MNDYADFWIKAKEQVKRFKKLDDNNLVFGATAYGSGHGYTIYPIMSIQEIHEIEKKKNITLPDEFKAYLMYFGAGGAGPDYGVDDVRETLKRTEFLSPFIYKGDETAGMWSNEAIDDFSGLMYVGTAGCGSDYYLELLGETVGKIWGTAGGGGCYTIENLCKFYSKWLDKVELGLTQYHQLKQAEIYFQQYEKVTLQDIVAYMDSDYREEICEKNIEIFFNDSRGAKVILNHERELLSFDFTDMHAIS